MLQACRYHLRIAWRKVIHRPVLSILLLLVIFYFLSTLTIMIYEDIGFTEATMEIFPAFFGEVGIVESPYLAVRISIVAGLMISVTFLAIVTAKITSLLVEFVRKGGSMVRKVNYSGHTIICGWNFQGERIIKELLAAGDTRHQGVVVLADSDERLAKDERVDFINGDPTQDSDLIRAGVERADSVIVLSDFNKGINEADAEALMVVLAVSL